MFDESDITPKKTAHRGARMLILAGICAILCGGCWAGVAEGFGDAPPPIDQARRQKALGVGIMLSGGAIAIVSAISLYLSDRKQN